MVDIKRQDITLSDWTKWISADEFAWGSYFYSEWIQSGYSTKWFKLWPAVEVDTLNERTNWFPIAVWQTSWWFVAFTEDMRLETSWTGNGSTYWTIDGWAIFCDTSWAWVWGYVYWPYALIFRSTSAERVNIGSIYDPDSQLLTNPRFQNSAAWWTVGTWWTVTNTWMQHTSGTWTLSTDITLSDEWYLRYAIKITSCTRWKVTVSTDVSGSDATVITTQTWTDGWYVGKDNKSTAGSQTVNITITPTSDFDWKVAVMNLFYFDYTNSYTTIAGLTNYYKHFAIEWGWDIYISSWDTIDILSTVDWTISDSKKLVWIWEEIVALTQAADALIIWTTNWADSFQYYWNWVDSVASEVIRWEWQVIRWVTWTEVISYVLTSPRIIGASWTMYRLYSVSGYQRSLIASNAYQSQSSQWNLENYHPSKKFVFDDVAWPESMTIYLDNLYLPWCDGIYQFWQTIPWLSKSWTRPIKYETWASRLFLFKLRESVWFIYTLNNKHYYCSLDEWAYQNHWYLVTDSIYRDKIGTRKALEKMKLGYKSLASNTGNIKIYAIVDDDYFWRFDVTWITDRPELWDIYQLSNVKMEVINIEKTSTTAWEITFRTTENKGSNVVESGNLSRVTWDGDATITWGNYDNMCLIKTIETENQGYGSDLIFGKDFVNNYMPYRHKIQLVIELNRTRNQLSDLSKTPEIYELSIQSDITDVVL